MGRGLGWKNAYVKKLELSINLLYCVTVWCSIVCLCECVTIYSESQKETNKQSLLHSCGNQLLHHSKITMVTNIRQQVYIYVMQGLLELRIQSGRDNRRDNTRTFHLLRNITSPVCSVMWKSLCSVFWPTSWSLNKPGKAYPRRKQNDQASWNIWGYASAHVTKDIIVQYRSSQYVLTLHYIHFYTSNWGKQSRLQSKSNISGLNIYLFAGFWNIFNLWCSCQTKLSIWHVKLTSFDGKKYSMLQMYKNNIIDRRSLFMTLYSARF